MLKLSPRLEKFLNNNEEIASWSRISIIELKVDDKIHTLVPAQCSNCDGAGKHLYGSLKGHAFTHSDMEEDSDFFDEMREGKYDVTCETCNGEGFYMILADDEENKSFIEEIELDAEVEAEIEAEIRMERRMLGEY